MGVASRLLPCLASAWLLLSLLALATPAHAVPVADLAARAQAAASREDWNTSARALEELVAAGVDSSEVLYDLGTVYAHAGRYGEAIWRLEQVTRRAAFATDAQQNLRAARLRLAHRDAGRTGRAVVETALPFRTWWSEVLPRDTAVGLTLLCEALALAGWLTWRRKRGGELARVAGAAGAILMAATAVTLGSMVVAQETVTPAAVVIHDGLRLLHAPTADAIPEEPVREGERVEIVARDAAFVRVRTLGGTQGWLATRDVGRLED